MKQNGNGEKYYKRSRTADQPGIATNIIIETRDERNAKAKRKLKEPGGCLGSCRWHVMLTNNPSSLERLDKEHLICILER